MDVLHREEVAAALDADVVDLRDVRVVKRRRQTRFVEEHVHEVLVVGVLRKDALDDDQLLEALDAHRARELGPYVGGDGVVVARHRGAG